MDPLEFGIRARVILVIALGLLLALLAGWAIGTGDYTPIFLGVGITGFLCLWFFSGRMFWVLTLASAFLAGTFPILGGSFTTFQFLTLIGLAKFVIEDLILRRTPISKTRRLDLILIAGFMGVLTLHAVQDRFGMKFLGSSIWGGRNYVNVYAGFAAFFVVQSVPVSNRVWSKLPYYILAVTFFDLVISILTAVVPATAYRIYPFYSAVSLLGVADEIGIASDPTSRIGGFGSFGVILAIIVLSTVSLSQIAQPQNLRRLALLLAGFVGTLLSGFRSSLINLLVVLGAAGLRDLRKGMFFFIPLVAIALFAVSVLNSQAIRLPRQVQRSLSFLPGDWDAEAKRDAIASNDFRTRVWTFWTNEFFPVHPWLGRGFGFRSDAAQISTYAGRTYYYQQMVETGNIHNGLLATVDTFGLVGALFFVAWQISLLVRAMRVRFVQHAREQFVLRFLALYLAMSIVSYWGGAQSVGSFLPGEFALAGLFLKLLRVRQVELQSGAQRQRVEAETPALAGSVAAARA